MEGSTATVSPSTRREPRKGHDWLKLSTAKQRALDALDVELSQLWGHISAAEYRFLELLAEFDRLEGWGRHGCASCAHWLNWRCGIGAVAARERVRVARALGELPLIRDAFREGRISYSKVRAMTRIATPDSEEDLLNIAVHGTASHVERLVRKYRWVERLEEAERAYGAHQHRSVCFEPQEDGSVLLRAKLPPEVAAVIRQALNAAVAVLEKAEKEPPPADHIENGSNVSAEASKPARTSPTVVAEPNVAEEARYQERQERTYGAKQADALVHLAEHYLHHRSSGCGSVADRYQVVVHIDQALLSRASEGEALGGTLRCELEEGPSLAVETVRRLGCDASLVGMVENGAGEPLSVGRKTRSIPPALKRALNSRDGGCRFPGCDRTRYTDGHHVKHWADGGETKLSNLVTLCKFHHRLIHEGGFEVSVAADGVFVFSRPDGSRVAETGYTPPVRAGIRVCGSRVEPSLFALNRERDLAIDAETIHCKWDGTKMDYGIAVGRLFWLRDLRQRNAAAA